jgi:serine protease Do
MKKSKKFTMNRFFWPGVVLLVLIIGAIWTNAGVVEQGPLRSPPQVSPLAPLPVQVPAAQGGQWASPQTALLIQEGISQVASMVRPAVVAVSGPMIAQMSAGTDLTYLNPYPGNSGLVGSGFIIDGRGYVLTTFRTVGKANLVRVTQFSGGRQEYQADVVGVDPKTDLALLKIRGQDLFPTVVLGNSDLIEVGDLVLAVGSPFGFTRTVTMGIVSSSGRELNIEGIRYPDMIQTDATINEGNDGGPLVNIRGEVIGVNMACYRPNNRYSGIGFAIPINDVLVFINANLG